MQLIDTWIWKFFTFLFFIIGIFKKSFKIEFIGKGEDKKSEFLNIQEINLHNAIKNFKLEDLNLKICLISKIFELKNLFFSTKNFKFFIQIDFEKEFFEISYKSSNNGLNEKINRSPCKIDLTCNFYKPSQKTYIIITLENKKLPNKSDSTLDVSLFVESIKGGIWKIPQYIGNFLIFSAQKKLKINYE